VGFVVGVRGYIQNFSDCVDNEIYAYLWYYSLLSTSKYPLTSLCNGPSVSATTGTDFLESCIGRVEIVLKFQ
jgi:hypothetical protein